MAKHRIGIDIGGTFTDFTVVRDDGEVVLWKEDSTPDDPLAGILRGLDAIAGELGGDRAGLLAATDVLVHGTTIATNMLIQRNGPAIGLLCTEGFRDVLYFRDGYKPERFNVHLPHPEPLVPRRLRLGVPERIDRDGRVVQPLDEAAVRAAARQLRDEGVEAVAIAFLWSMLNSGHERRAAEIVREELPAAHVICSHVVLPEIREWQRTSATVLSAYIVPRIAEYLTRFEAEMRAGGLAQPPLIMQINGGCARVREIVKRPINVLASGPAAAPKAALYHASATQRDLIAIDMGGTSLDVCLIADGRATMSRDVQVEAQPIGVPAVDVQSVGAGGGSIGWIDDGGALRVGPRSAGARPGPACYGFGGTEPTVTDANVVLGRLAPEAFLGGRRTLRADLSARAVEQHVAATLGLSVADAAAGMIRVVNANMVAAIRSVSVERGIDPRGFTLVSGGGAGGLHAAALARELGMRAVFVPLQAGVFCSFGMTVTDVRHDHLVSHHALSDALDHDAVAAVLRELGERASAELREEGFAPGEIALEWSVDARYPGQVHEMTVPVAMEPGRLRPDVEATVAGFHAAHQERYAYNRPAMAVELLHWRVAASGRRARELPAAAASGSAEIAPRAVRDAYSAALGAFAPTPVHDVADLGVGASIAGPAILTAPTTTIVIDAGDTLSRPTANGFSISVATDDAQRRRRDADTTTTTRPLAGADADAARSERGRTC
ncbi:hydantoinase/oxoprolinase family protein [Conexibacter sp. CPCC 206217]|uniref:hydantoinase/oxoprolinase family protein n=1 Tax=Conexibacter sp. CPCC 206217 TaxID=3064574 RepID=UPI0027260FEE|nr:hydantoinase/oxoprolinase family protein [Conexibacter sp. CPCC 206217]MDO8209631.1 hydantoinase/oxoprolinase family protein [Conexibacter sp. CPCC 206217]